MYNLNGENVNDNPNGFSGNEPAGNPNPDNNAQMNYGQPSPEQQTYNQPENGPQTYDAPNANQQQAFNQTDYNPNSFNQNAYNQSAYNQPDYGQQAFNNGNTYNGNSYNAAPSYNLNGDAPKNPVFWCPWSDSWYRCFTFRMVCSNYRNHSWYRCYHSFHSWNG